MCTEKKPRFLVKTQQCYTQKPAWGEEIWALYNTGQEVTTGKGHNKII